MDLLSITIINILALVPSGVKGEILEEWYKFSLKQVCEALQNELL